MAKIEFGSVAGNIRPILAAVRSVPVPVHPEQAGGQGRRPAPFVTLARQPGAGARTLAQRLVEYLNLADPGEQPWTCWDRELVEKVAADHQISEQLVESLENTSHSFLQDFLSGLSFQDGTEWADEVRVYHSVARTIRALAQVGRVVIVGRGGVFVTRNMPGGIHVRLVAPLAQRIDHMMHHLNISQDEAAHHVRQLEKNRAAFYRRYWPQESLDPENFTMTLNAGVLGEHQVIGCILPLVSAAAVKAPAHTQAGA